MNDCYIFSYLLRLNRRRVRCLRQALNPHQYVGTMHLLMFYLSNHPGASQDEICEHFTLDKTNVARDAKRLEELGHIRRQVDTNNRRQYQLYLTEAGESFIPVINAAYEHFSKKIVANLSPQEIETLGVLLQKLDDNTASLP